MQAQHVRSPTRHWKDEVDALPELCGKAVCYQDLLEPMTVGRIQENGELVVNVSVGHGDQEVAPAQLSQIIGEKKPGVCKAERIDAKPAELCSEIRRNGARRPDPKDRDPLRARYCFNRGPKHCGRYVTAETLDGLAV